MNSPHHYILDLLQGTFAVCSVVLGVFIQQVEALTPLVQFAALCLGGIVVPIVTVWSIIARHRREKAALNAALRPSSNPNPTTDP